MEYLVTIPIIIIFIVLYLIQRHDHNRELIEWEAERKELLDRIAAKNIGELERLKGKKPVYEPIESAHDRNINKWREGSGSYTEV